MRNVKVILISVALCATVFANQRIAALGGDAGFWAGDRANVVDFPATINDHQFLEIANIGSDDASATLLWGDATKWGFEFDNDASNNDSNPWFNLYWGNGDMGLNIAYISTDDGQTEPGTDDVESGFHVSWGQNMSFGELGVHFKSTSNTCDAKCDESSYSVNWRGDMGAWVFDSAKASLAIASEDHDGSNNDEDTMDYFQKLADDG